MHQFELFRASLSKNIPVLLLNGIARNKADFCTDAMASVIH
jgi:hypothetical protein